MLITEIHAGANKVNKEHMKLERGSKKDCKKEKDEKFPHFPEMNICSGRDVEYTDD